MKPAIQTSLPFVDARDELLDLASVSERLGISTATARNWVKSGILAAEDTPSGKMGFHVEQLKSLHDSMNAGVFRRLQGRANKKASAATFIPQEYAASKTLRREIEQCVEHFRASGADMKAFLYAVIVQMISRKNIKPSIKTELEWWSQGSFIVQGLPPFDTSETHLDFLGLLYQSLLAEGTKTTLGSYYTPAAIAQSMVGLHVEPASTFLDPCCGTGLFLMQAAQIIKDPRAIWGFDIDPIAVRIARINLLLQYPEHDFTPNIFHGSGLLDASGEFDVVATNPPWGGHFSAQELSSLRAHFHIGASDSFAFFLLASLGLFRQGGSLSLLLPEAFLNIKTHKSLRRLLLENATITAVSSLGRVFQNVFSPVVRVDAKKRLPPKGTSFLARDGGSEIRITQESVLRNEDCIFDIRSSDEERELLDEIFAKRHATLHGHAEWALGIVTGDNARFVLETPEEGAEPLWIGRDLRRFVANKPARYIKFQPESFQQVAPTKRYRAAEKLVYRFISDELVFAYDNKQTLVLNSANVLIPKLDGYSIKSVLAFLNSQVFQFVFKRRFQSIKVLRGDLEKLPFPQISASTDQELTRLVDVVLDKDPNAASAYQDINRLVMDAFLLKADHRTFIERCVSVSLGRVSRR